MGQGKGGTMLRGLSQQRVLIRPAPGNPEQWLSLSCPTTQGFQKCVFVFLTEAFKNSVGFSKEGNEDQCWNPTTLISIPKKRPATCLPFVSFYLQGPKQMGFMKKSEWCIPWHFTPGMEGDPPNVHQTHLLCTSEPWVWTDWHPVTHLSGQSGDSWSFGHLAGGGLNDFRGKPCVQKPLRESPSPACHGPHIELLAAGSPVQMAHLSSHTPTSHLKGDSDWYAQKKRRWVFKILFISLQMCF